MKMIKKVLAGAMAAVMAMSFSVGVSAAGSRTGNVTVTDDSAYTVEANIQNTDAYKALQESAPEVVDMIDKVNNGTYDMENFIAELSEDSAEVAKALEGKDFVTGFFDLIATDNAKKNANGKYEVTLSVPGLTAQTTGVMVLHYSTERNLWEIIKPTAVNLDAKTITVEFEDLSPVGIVADKGTLTSSTADSQAQGTSPKTEGMNSVWMMWFGAALVLAAAGSVVVLRKRNCQ